MAKIQEKITEILQLTQDGLRLTPLDRELLRKAITGTLSAIEEDRFLELAREVAVGDYAKYYGLPTWTTLPFLVKDSQGYVYWKGQHVEHYSFRDKADELAAATQLAAHCQHLEDNGFPVNSRTAIHENCYTAPNDSVWKTALVRYYCFFKNSGQILGIFHKRSTSESGATEAFSVNKTASGITVTAHPDAYTAFHALQNAGMQSIKPPTTYAETEHLLAAIGLTPFELDALLR